MNYVDSGGSYMLPFFLAVCLHLAVGIGVNFQWSKSDNNLIRSDRPIYLNATLVQGHVVEDQTLAAKVVGQVRRSVELPQGLLEYGVHVQANAGHDVIAVPGNPCGGVKGGDVTSQVSGNAFQ